MGISWWHGWVEKRPIQQAQTLILGEHQTWYQSLCLAERLSASLGTRPLHSPRRDD